MKLLIDALNILIWKIPKRQGIFTPEDQAAFLMAELSDKGISGFHWNVKNQRFEENE